MIEPTPIRKIRASQIGWVHLPLNRDEHKQINTWLKPQPKLLCIDSDMAVSENGGTPKWMVYNGKPLLKWMIWGYPYFRKHPYRLWDLWDDLSFFCAFHGSAFSLEHHLPNRQRTCKILNECTTKTEATRKNLLGEKKPKFLEDFGRLPTQRFGEKNVIISVIRRH